MVDKRTLHKVQQALERYKEEIALTPLSPGSQYTYSRHAESFVRWLAGDFKPGSSLMKLLKKN